MYLTARSLGGPAGSRVRLFSKKHSVCISDAVKAIARVVLSSSVCAFLLLGSLFVFASCLVFADIASFLILDSLLAIRGSFGDLAAFATLESFSILGLLLLLGSLFAVLLFVCYHLSYLGRCLLDKSSNIVEKLSMLLASLFMFFQHVDFSFLTHFLSKVFTVAFGGSLPLSLDFSGGVVCMPPLGFTDKR